MHSRQSPQRLSDIRSPSSAALSIISRCQRRSRSQEFLASVRNGCREEMRKFARETLSPRWKYRNRGVSRRVGRSGRSENAGFNRAVPRHRIAVVVVSRTSRHRQDQTHRAVRSPSLSLSIGTRARETRANNPRPQSRAIRATEIAAAREEEERADRRENEKRERIECAPAKAVAVGGEERGREGGIS